MKTLQSTQKLDFQGESIYAGIDVHKKQWNVFIMSDYKEHKGFVQRPEPAILSKYLRENFPGATYYSVYEAGFSGFWIHEALKKEGINNIVVNPADVPTKDKEKKQKCDRVDSRKLCKKLRDKDLEGIHIPERVQLEDRDLVRLRRKLVRDTTRCKNRIKGLLNFYGIPYTVSSCWSIKFIKWLSELELSYPSGTLVLRILIAELQSIDQLKKQVSRKLLALTREEKYAELIKLLYSIPGIGLIAALTLITELGDIRRFKRFDYLCNYIGLVPTLYSTGDTKQVGHLTPRKNTYLLPIVIQCAWTAAGRDPALMQAYHQWCRRMKGQQAIIRVARKLLRRIRYVLIHQNEYKLKTVS
jgi:transposase